MSDPMIGGVRIDAEAACALPGLVAERLTAGGSCVVHFVAAYCTVLARRDPEYRRVLNAGDINVADGAPVALAVRLLGRDAERLPGSQALQLLSRWGVERGVRHYLYGGGPGVAAALRARLLADNPGIHIVGAEEPPYGALDDDELMRLASAAAEAKSDLLWIGLGTPKQDFAAERLRELGASPVILCVGAAFDFVSGAKQRAPLWMQRTGLEWLHRLGSEPRRLWRRYLIGNPLFLAGAARDIVKAKWAP